MHNHSFYLALSYGAAALAVLIEVALLWQRCRKQREALLPEDGR